MFTIFKSKKIPLTKLFPKDFVDIHAHILPGIDDGSATEEEAIALLKRMQSYGIHHIICTPHIMEGVWENTPEIITQALEKLKQTMQQQGISDIHISAAAEYMLDQQFNELLATKNLLTLKDNYLLIELSFFNPPINLYEILFNIQIAGYKPILAHPERYLFFHNKMEEYQKLKNAGCLFQLNLLSVTSYYGKNIQTVAQQLLKENLYDFVGTDTHHSNHLAVLEKITHKKTLARIQPLLQNNTIFK